MWKLLIKKTTRMKILVDIEQIEEVIKVLNRYNCDKSLKIGNCGWEKAPNCYYVIFNVNDDEVDLECLIDYMRNRGIVFLPESTTGY